jgi:hypothetical protein
MDQIQIVDAAGNVATVEDGRLYTVPRSEFEDAIAAGLAFAINGDTYDYAALDTIVGVKNDAEDFDLVVKRVLVTGDTATEFVGHTSAGVTMAGTALTPVNLNRASGVAGSAHMTAIRDETGNGQAAASYSGKVLTGRFAANAVADVDDLDIVLPPGWMFGVDLTTDGAACGATLFVYMRPRSRS